MSENEKTPGSVTPEHVIDAARTVAKKSDEAFLFLVRSVSNTALRIVSETLTVGRAAKKAANVSASFTRMGVDKVRKQLKELSDKAEQAGDEEKDEDLLSDEPAEEAEKEKPDEEPDEEEAAPSALAALAAAAADDEASSDDEEKPDEEKPADEADGAEGGEDGDEDEKGDEEKDDEGDA